MKYIKSFRIFENNKVEKVVLYFTSDFIDEENADSIPITCNLFWDNEGIPQVQSDKETIYNESITSYDAEKLGKIANNYKRVGLKSHLRKDFYDETKSDIVYKGWYPEDGEDVEGLFEVNCAALNAAFKEKTLFLEEYKDSWSDETSYYVKAKV